MPFPGGRRTMKDIDIFDALWVTIFVLVLIGFVVISYIGIAEMNYMQTGCINAGYPYYHSAITTGEQIVVGDEIFICYNDRGESIVIGAE
jgi:hypothetical protein